MILRPMRSTSLTLAWADRAIRRSREAHGLVLMYHRITPASIDPWNLIVEPETFRDQISVLQSIADVVPLRDLPGSMRTRRGGRPVIAITLDDGYKDNLDFALPVLEEAGCPATVFLPTGWIGLEAPFWWDRLAWILLGPERLPGRLEIEVGEKTLTWSTPKRSGAGRGRTDVQNELHREIWTALRLETQSTRETVMDELARWTGVDAGPEKAGRPMHEDEVRRLVSSGTVSIGGHSVTHRPLAELSPESQESEIRRSLDRCEEIVGHRPDTFAYPHGSISTSAIERAGRSGVSLACSSEKELAWTSSHPMSMPRIPVLNWSANRFERWLRWYWLP